ncbi:MAG: PepSY-like domain-containing protein [Bacteroidia bacterium]|nr:PepSY-like domain-containing protein [Bacteroidia bacterium]
MKTKTLLSVSLLALFCSCSGDSVPEAVRSAFRQQFPAAADTEWEKEDANFEAEFTMDSKEYSALFDASGQLLETEYEIPADSLPAAVHAYISQNLSGTKITEAAHIRDASGHVSYEAETGDKDLIFDENGTYVKTVAH